MSPQTAFLAAVRNDPKALEQRLRLLNLMTIVKLGLVLR